MTGDGNWNLVVTTPLGERRGVLSLSTEGKIAGEGTEYDNSYVGQQQLTPLRFVNSGTSCLRPLS